MPSDKKSDAKKFEHEYLMLRHFAAKHAWLYRDELTPIAKIPWSEWFRRKFGMSLGQYKEWLDKRKEKRDTQK